MSESEQLVFSLAMFQLKRECFSRVFGLKSKKLALVSDVSEDIKKVGVKFQSKSVIIISIVDHSEAVNVSKGLLSLISTPSWNNFESDVRKNFRSNKIGLGQSAI